MPAAALLIAAVAVGIVPGLLVTMAWKPKPELTAMEAVGFGAAVSFGLVQFMAIIAIAAHLSTGVMLAMLAAGCAVMVALLIRRPRVAIAMRLDEFILAGLLIVLGVFLYRLGSPVEWYEDQVHAAVVRRLTGLAAPRVDNIYFVPGIVYTYVFPGTHYFMALVARLSDLDPLFVYHKLRFFWGPVAVIMLYLAARAVFGSSGVASAVAITAVLFVFTGTFAMVPGFPSGWGQLVPFSHASDVAMTVLLPALLVMCFGYLLAASVRERRFFLAAAAMLVVMLTIVHIREVVQVAAYLGCFLIVTIAVRRFRPYAGRTAALLALLVAIAAAYTMWQAEVVVRTATVVADQRARLVSIASASSLRELLFTPAQDLLDQFVLNGDLLFVGLTPLFLFAGPAVLLLFRDQPLAWFAAASTLAYLMVMTVPLLAIPYIYLTYFEILFTPVRNIIVFVYLLAGAAVYACAIALARLNWMKMAPLLGGAIAGLLSLLVALSINRSATGFVAPLIAAYILALMLAIGVPLQWRPDFRAAAAVVLVGVAFFALLPDREPVARRSQVAVRWNADLPNQDRAALERQFSLHDGEPNSNRSASVNVWNYMLDDTSRDNVRALVEHPLVVDTAAIDRSRFTVPPQPPADDDPYFAVRHLRWIQYPGAALFMAAALFAWAIGFLLPAALSSSRGQQAAASLAAAWNAPFYRHIVPYACFMIPLALWSWRPTLSPLTAPGAPAIADPAAMIAQLPCLTTDARPAPFSEDVLNGEALMLPERTSCPPDRAVVEWIRSNVPIDAVFAIDRWNPYLPSVFIPQQVVVYPQVEVTFENEDELFASYHAFYSERLRASRAQPFFNSVETPQDRAAFIKALGVTHVLVDPAYYREMRQVLDQLPGQYALRFSEAEWAVYEVLRPAPGV